MDNNETDSEVRVSYLAMSSGPTLWGTVGSIVTEPGEGRWMLVRRLDPQRGPKGYLVIDLVDAEIHRGFDTERDAREHVSRLAAIHAPTA